MRGVRRGAAEEEEEVVAVVHTFEEGWRSKGLAAMEERMRGGTIKT